MGFNCNIILQLKPMKRFSKSKPYVLAKSLQWKLFRWSVSHAGSLPRMDYVSFMKGISQHYCVGTQSHLYVYFIIKFSCSKHRNLLWNKYLVWYVLMLFNTMIWFSFYFASTVTDNKSRVFKLFSRVFYNHSFFVITSGHFVPHGITN